MENKKLVACYESSIFGNTQKYGIPLVFEQLQLIQNILEEEFDITEEESNCEKRKTIMNIVTLIRKNIQKLVYQQPNTFRSKSVKQQRTAQNIFVKLKSVVSTLFLKYETELSNLNNDNISKIIETIIQESIMTVAHTIDPIPYLLNAGLYKAKGSIKGRRCPCLDCQGSSKKIHDAKQIQKKVLNPAYIIKEYKPQKDPFPIWYIYSNPDDIHGYKTEEKKKSLHVKNPELWGYDPTKRIGYRVQHKITKKFPVFGEGTFEKYKGARRVYVNGLNKIELNNLVFSQLNYEYQKKLREYIKLMINRRKLCVPDGGWVGNCQTYTYGHAKPSFFEV